jgi:hypothetical protein
MYEHTEQLPASDSLWHRLVSSSGKVTQSIHAWNMVCLISLGGGGGGA